MRYRTLFLSDIHLGSPDCRAVELIDFLRHNECDRLYLVGDIFDFWALKRQWYWPQSHNDVIQKLLRKVRKGTKIIYVPGNHDEAARTFSGFRLGGISVARETMHVTADGRRLLVLHGDQFDAVLGYPSFFPIGASAWKLLRFVARALNVFLGWFGRRQWSLAGMLAQAQDGIGLKTRFRELVREEARARGFDGVLCGHLHWPEHLERDGIAYLNTGDWVDHNTAVAEHEDGRLELLNWPIVQAESLRQPAVPAATPQRVGGEGRKVGGRR